MLKPFLASAAALALLAAPAALIAHSTGTPLAPGEAQHYVIHVPRITITTTTIVTARRTAPPPPPAPMVERKAKDCIRTQRIVAFAVTERDSVDLMLSDGTRMRAKLGSKCPALDFYSGIYIRPNPDGKMCVNRDTIRSRSGGSCEIQGFRTLVPAR